ncbi:MAG: YeeE/YedE family protein [Acidobacteria bacterium]|nr:YeeE/YedE family protein [Acidobacteriota bacterium]
MGVPKEIFELIFRKPLSVWSAALLLAMVNILLFAYEKPWSASDGLRNWGDWIFYALGWPIASETVPAWFYSGSVLNTGLVSGAVVSALLSRQFALRIASGLDLGNGLVGGALMGVGAVLAMGCNIGGFYSALSALSLAGLSMLAGLLAGAFVGLRCLSWEQEYLGGFFSASGREFLSAPREGWSLQPWLGAFGLCAVALAVVVYTQVGYPERGVLLIFGLLLGVILQRSRFCPVRAFREPFMTGDSEMTRALVLSLGLCIFGFSILKSSGLRSLDAFVFPAFWQGSLWGGCVFGVGMVLAGGCGAGSLWRAAEGHIKLGFALAAFALSSSLTRRYLERSELISEMGQAFFLPDLTGWPLALGCLMGLLLGWYAWAAWNEKSRRFVSL